MSVFTAAGTTYDDAGRLVRDIHVNLLTNQPGLLTAVTENVVCDNNLNTILNNNLNPIYTKKI